MEQNELDEILKDHKLWLYSEGKKGKRANLRGADLRRVDLSGADLYEADLRWSDLRDADLSWANLRKADLRDVNLTGVDLSYTDLREADLSGADLTGVDLKEVDFEGAILYDIKGKEILTFQYNGKHFAYYCDGYLKIGCKTLDIDEWLERYKEIGKIERYTDKEIKRYGDFIKYCKREMT